ncbi:hypothetical protein KAW50_02630 [candidate division WOR-3 bacterium]|nr:hypothetical protein [candidate division WOR-3 bacterium]
MADTKFPKEYFKDDIGEPDKIFTTYYQFDSRGRLIQPWSPYQKFIFTTSPGSKDVKAGSESPASEPLTDPGSIKTGYLYADTAIKCGPQDGWIVIIQGGNEEYPIIYINETTNVANFWVDKNGNVYLSGEIHASAGVIGGWTITTTSLEASDIYLYSTGTIQLKGAADVIIWDDTTGGVSPPTGEAADIIFPRTDDNDMYFRIRKRAGINVDSENVLEMYYSKPSASRNYVFIGRDGTALAYYTDVIAESVAQLWQTGTAGIMIPLDFNEIQIYNSLAPGSIMDAGGTRVVIFPKECTTPVPYCPLDGSGGSVIAFGYSTNAGATALQLWIDHNGICIANEPVYPYSDQGCDLGSLGIDDGCGAGLTPRYWKDLYIKGHFRDGVNNKTLADLVAGTGLLSGLTIDVDKDWQAKHITNIGRLSCALLNVNCSSMQNTIAGDLHLQGDLIFNATRDIKRIADICFSFEAANIKAGKNLVPSGAFTLGSVGSQWTDIRAVDETLSGDLQVDGATRVNGQIWGGSLKLDTLMFGGAIIPDSWFSATIGGANIKICCRTAP